MWLLLTVTVLLGAVALYDLSQRRHTILRNFPVIGHLRFWVEAVGPHLRQYIVADDNEERPFSRDERRWIYASAKKENDYFGFGTDNELERTPSYLIIKHKVFPLSQPHPGRPPGEPDYLLPCAKVLGQYRGRRAAFRPTSVVNISAMSFGALSAPAVAALNKCARLADCLHNSGEGGLTTYHGQGGQLIWQIGTGYFGCRDERGRFSLERMLQRLEQHPHVRAIEIKLSQGAKPGVGGILPGVKVTPEIAAIRTISVGEDCISPAAHSAFSDADSLLDFVERLAEATGLPVGIKSAVGEQHFWQDLARLTATTHRGVDFVTVDGGEGGTGAGPLTFTDHVALPFKLAFARVYRTFAEYGLHERVVFIGSGKLGLPEAALFAFALGADLINLAREPMLALGCIQAKKCHTGGCPTGITTHNRWLTRGLDVSLKAARAANYIITLRKELCRLSRACGVPHPALVNAEHFEVLGDRFDSTDIYRLFGYTAGMGLPAALDRELITEIMLQYAETIPG